MTEEARTGFRWWMAGASASELGDSMTFFALAWIAASHGPGVASLVLMLESVPLVMFILAGGALADRFGARYVMIACDAFMALVMACFAVAALIDVPVWALAAVALLSGTAAALRRPAAGVFPRLFFRGDELSKAMASATLFQQIAQMAGPSVGGVLLAAGGIALTAGTDALTFLVVLIVLLAVRPPHEPSATSQEQRSLLHQIGEGIRAARAVPGATATIVTIVCMAATILPLVSLCLPLVGHARGWTAGQTGLVSGAWVVGGMLVMAIVSRRGMPSQRVALTGPPLAAAGACLLAVTSSPLVAIVALIAVGVGTSMLTTRLFPRFMDATPAELLSRFQSLLGLAQAGPVLIATALLGGLIAATEPAAALVGIAIVLALTIWPATQADVRLPSNHGGAALPVPTESANS